MKLVKWLFPLDTNIVSCRVCAHRAEMSLSSALQVPMPYRSLILDSPQVSSVFNGGHHPDLQHWMPPGGKRRQPLSNRMRLVQVVSLSSTSPSKKGWLDPAGEWRRLDFGHCRYLIPLPITHLVRALVNWIRTGQASSLKCCSSGLFVRRAGRAQT